MGWELMSCHQDNRSLAGHKTNLEDQTCCGPVMLPAPKKVT